MNILLSNDDGYYAKGIQLLAAELRKFNNLVVIAPDRNCSGTSHSLTLGSPLRIRQLGENDYCVNGTPTDCVHLALHGFLEQPIDLVISGINAGANLGDDTLYSGTVAAAFEGRHLAVPAIAVSLNGKQYYQTAAKIVCDLLPYLKAALLGKNQIINVNVPDLPYEQIKGIKVCRLGQRLPAGKLIKQQDPRGDDIYWIGPPGLASESENENTDFYAVKNGYVAITPIQTDMTAYQSISTLQYWLDGQSRSFK